MHASWIALSLHFALASSKAASLRPGHEKLKMLKDLVRTIRKDHKDLESHLASLIFVSLQC